MNLDKTFCSNRECVKTYDCDRHRNRLTEWVNVRPENMAMLEFKPISVSEFSPNKDGYCEYFIEKEKI